MSSKIIEILKQLVAHLEYYNLMSPFPIYDTEYITDIKTRIKDMEQSKRDYDELPVAACKYCKSLHIENDEADNDICMRCGSVNDIVIYNTIHEYLEEVEKE